MERLAKANAESINVFDHSLALSIINTLNSPDSDQLLDDARLVLSELQFHDGDETQVFLNLLTNGSLTPARANMAFELLAQMAQQQNMASFENDFHDENTTMLGSVDIDGKKESVARQVAQVGAVATAEVIDDEAYFFDAGQSFWQVLAACGDTDPEMFFMDSEVKQAKSICKNCPVKNDCLDHAIRAKDDNGVWGGLTGDERRALRRKNKKRH